MISWGLFQGYKDGSISKNQINVIYHINTTKDRNHMIIILDAGRAFDKMQHSYMIFKNSQQRVYRGNVHQYNKDCV